MARILLIDDDPTLRKLMRRALVRLGHRVVEASDGEEGLGRLAETKLDLVVTDLIMPGMEGIETIQEVRERYPEVKVLAVSGGGQQGPDGPLEDALLLGAHASLAKPFTLEELEAVVTRLLQSSAA